MSRALKKCFQIKLDWEKPQLSNLGRLKDLVQCGAARGKSPVDTDGSSCGFNESMAQMNTGISSNNDSDWNTFDLED